METKKGKSSLLKEQSSYLNSTKKNSCSRNKEDIQNNQKITFCFKMLSFPKRKNYSLKAIIELLDTFNDKMISSDVNYLRSCKLFSGLVIPFFFFLSEQQLVWKTILSTVAHLCTMTPVSQLCHLPFNHVTQNL